MEVYHIRNEDEEGNILNNGGLTIVYRIDEYSISFGWALCCNEDNYDKKLGRQIAVERLASCPEIIYEEEFFRGLNKSVSHQTLRGLNKSAVDKVNENLKLEDLSPEFIVETIIFHEQSK
jgi:hypothetical protein